jgi:hypothetical protein
MQLLLAASWLPQRDLVSQIGERVKTRAHLKVVGNVSEVEARAQPTNIFGLDTSLRMQHHNRGCIYLVYFGMYRKRR